MFSTVIRANVPYNNYHLPHNSKTCITICKMKTIAKGNIFYVSLLKLQRNSDFEFFSVSFFGRYSY